MFGCGQYPAHDAMIESVKLEAEQAVKRLRDHPSLVIFVSSCRSRLRVCTAVADALLLL